MEHTLRRCARCLHAALGLTAATAPASPRSRQCDAISAVLRHGGTSGGAVRVCSMTPVWRALARTPALCPAVPGGQWFSNAEGQMPSASVTRQPPSEAGHSAGPGQPEAPSEDQNVSTHAGGQACVLAGPLRGLLHAGLRCALLCQAAGVTTMQRARCALHWWHTSHPA